MLNDISFSGNYILNYGLLGHSHTWTYFHIHSLFVYLHVSKEIERVLLIGIFLCIPENHFLESLKIKIYLLI